jgi:hypothetical protein
VVGVVVVVLTPMVSSCAEMNPDAKSSSESATTRSPCNGENKRKDMLNFDMESNTKHEQTRNEQ